MVNRKRSAIFPNTHLFSRKQKAMRERKALSNTQSYHTRKIAQSFSYALMRGAYEGREGIVRFARLSCTGWAIGFGVAFGPTLPCGLLIGAPKNLALDRWGHNIMLPRNGFHSHEDGRTVAVVWGRRHGTFSYQTNRPVPDRLPLPPQNDKTPHF
jgi:hypothetical protein